MTDIWFRTGEATVLAAEGQSTDAMPEVLIGSVRGPVGQAFAVDDGAGQGPYAHVRGARPQPARAPGHDDDHQGHDQTWPSMPNCSAASCRRPPATRSSTASSRASCPRTRLDELCMIIMIWLDPRCAEDENLDRKDLYRTNYEATKLAIVARHDGRADGRRADRQPQDGQALRAGRRDRVLSRRAFAFAPARRRVLSEDAAQRRLLSFEYSAAETLALRFARFWP